MKDIWALQDAKARLSELVKLAEKEGPQTVSVHGSPKIVIISQKDYDALTTPPQTLVDFFQQSPLSDLEIDLSRDKSSPRDVDL